MCQEQTEKPHTTARMHVTACLAGQEADVEVGENCRTTQALKEAIVRALPQLCVDGFDVSVGGCELDDEGVVSLEENVALAVSANARCLSVLALREADCDVSEAALLEAAKQGDVTLCALYLDAGVPIDCVDKYSRTPLFLSCANGHLEIAKLLLDRGSTVIDVKGMACQTPLLVSCENGHLEIAKLLLDRGSAAIDEKDRDGQTPFFLSCENGHLETARFLLDRGSAAIDVKADKYTDDIGVTPLLVSCRDGHLEIVRLLLDRGSTVIDEKDGFDQTPLFLSCLNGHLDIVALLLDRGCTTINEQDNHGQTPLFAAGANGHLGIVRLLLDRGSTAPVETYRDRGFSQEVVEFLDKLGATRPVLL